VFSAIVAGCDASPASRAAIELAIEIGKANGSELYLVNVVDVAKLVPLSGYEGPYPEEAVNMMCDEGQSLIDGLVQHAQNAGVKASGCVTQGDAADEILNAASERKAELIVMGTHGRTGLARLVVGSVADAVLRRAPCPVLVTH